MSYKFRLLALPYFLVHYIVQRVELSRRGPGGGGPRPRRWIASRPLNWVKGTEPPWSACLGAVVTQTCIDYIPDSSCWPWHCMTCSVSFTHWHLNCLHEGLLLPAVPTGAGRHPQEGDGLPLTSQSVGGHLHTSAGDDAHHPIRREGAGLHPTTHPGGDHPRTVHCPIVLHQSGEVAYA